MMRRLLYFFLSLSATFTLKAADPPVERIFVSTDREVYIAGDLVWCSLFCMDVSGSLSPFSAVSYLELISTDGTVAQAKVGLLEGRGAGTFRIPVDTPTGVYRLVSYTSRNADEEGGLWMGGSRILTIFNTLSGARVKNGVEILDPDSYESRERPSRPQSGSLEFSASAHVRAGSELPLFVNNPGEDANISLSVYHEDDLLPAIQDNTIEGFLRALPSSIPVRVGDSRPSEFDGEVISATIKGEMADDQDYSIATLSTAGSPSNLYVGVTANDKVSFHTNNIYGDREIVCEVSRLDKKEGVIEFDDPFIHPSSGPLPKLLMSTVQRESLSSRKSSLRSAKAIHIDTLVTLMRHREDLLLESSAFHRYHLDDYTRFPSVREVLVEIVPSLKLHREKGVYSIQMAVLDASGSRAFRVGNVLVMMDGVVLTDLGPLLDFDAMLLEDVDVYQQAVVCGQVIFSGVVNFTTKKNYVTAMSFPSNVRVLDFKGVSYPAAYFGSAPEGDMKDLRQLLYWDPVCRLKSGEARRVIIRTPDYSGRFRVVAEGLSAQGTPIHSEWTFEVE